MNNTRLIATSIVLAFVANIVFNYLYHCSYMMDSYLATSNLWRSSESMQTYGAFNFLGQLILVSVAGLIFARGYEGKGYMEGFRFGLLIGFILVGQTFTSYAYTPIPENILNGWIVGNLLQGVVIGLSLVLAYVACGTEKKAVKAKPAKSKKK